MNHIYFIECHLDVSLCSDMDYFLIQENHQVCLFTGLEPVIGALEWSTEWSTRVEYWSGQWHLLVLLFIWN